MKFPPVIRKPLSIALLLLLIGGFQPPLYAKNLLELAKLAKHNDHTYRQTLDKNAASKLQSNIDRGVLIPSIDASGSYTYANTLVTSGSQTTGVSIGVTHRFQLSDFEKLTADQYLSLSAQLNDLVAYQDLLNRLSLAYFTVAKDQLILNTDKENLSTSRKFLAIIIKLYKGGERTRTEVLNAKVNINSNQSAVITETNQLAIDQSKLQIITGIKPTRLALLTSRTPFALPLPLLSHQIIAIATSDNPQILAAHYATLQALSTVRQTRQGRLPYVTANVNYTKPLSSSPYPSESHPGIAATLSLDVPLFQPSMSATILQMEKQYDLSLEQRKLMQAEVRDALRQSYISLVNDHKQINALTTNIVSAKKALKSSLFSYQGGLGDYSTVLTAEQAVVTQQQANITAKYDYMANYIMLRKSMGTLSLKTISEVNHWLQ